MRTWSRTTSLTVLAVLASPPAFAQNGKITGKVDATPAKYLEETVVYVKEAPGATAAPKKVSMDQKGMQFIPHVLAITTGDTVEFLNNDNLPHNVYSPDNGGFNLGSFNMGESRSQTFSKPGTYAILCSIHPEMLAYVFGAPTPYSAVIGKDGKYEISNVPPGTYQVAIWNSKLKAPEQTVTVVSGKPAQANFTLKR